MAEGDGTDATVTSRLASVVRPSKEQPVASTWTSVEVFKFFKALFAGGAERKRALRWLVVFAGWWCFAGSVISTLLAIGESSTLGFRAALRSYGLWWLAIPGIITLFPFAFMLCIAGLEVALFTVFLPVLVLRERWRRALHLLFLVGAAAFFGWILFSVGQDVGRPTLPPPEARPVLPMPPTITVPPHAGPGTIEWLRSNWVAIAFGSVILKIFETVVSDWFKRKLTPKPKEPAPTTPLLYGPDGRILRERSDERRRDS